jgi:hypothetical protein
MGYHLLKRKCKEVVEQIRSSSAEAGCNFAVLVSISASKPMISVKEGT